MSWPNMAIGSGTTSVEVDNAQSNWDFAVQPGPAASRCRPVQLGDGGLLFFCGPFGSASLV
jgi:hypothetical protein